MAAILSVKKGALLSLATFTFIAGDYIELYRVSQKLLYHV